MKPLYNIQGLKHYYNGHPALDIESLTIQSGTITGIIGPNGSGKSTLLKMLAFIDRSKQGQIQFKGRPAEPFSDQVRFQVTLLTQEPYLMKRSVFKNIAYGLELRRDTHDMESRVHEALSWVGLSPRVFSQRKWYELSGGEAQRVALAARLILKPAVLLLDEPTASIDAASAQIIKDITLMARDYWGTTLVIASHDWEWLYDICEHVVHLFRGRLFGSGRQNFIFGPWRQQPNGTWAKELHDGQLLVVTNPPTEDAVAILDPLHLELLDSEKACTLNGMITRQLYDKDSRDILLVVQVANQAITTRLSGGSVHKNGYYPGQTVKLSYHPTNLTWY